MNLILFDKDEIIPRDESSAFEITLKLTDPRAVHILKILKGTNGSLFDAGIINDKRGKAVIDSITGENIQLSFTPEAEPVGLTPLTLLLGLSRPPTVKKVLKEATALGVARFILCGTENSERSYRDSNALKPDKIREVLLEGVQQAVCTMLPETTVEHSLRCAIEAVTPAQPGTLLIALDNYEATISLTDFWQNNRPAGRTESETVLAVGSERGWTNKERDRLRNAGFTLCSLGPRVLRTETASIAGTAVCLSGMGLI